MITRVPTYRAPDSGLVMLEPRLGAVADILLGTVTLALGIIHLALGASPSVVGLAVLGWLACYLPARTTGLGDFGAVLILLIGLKYTLVAAVLLVPYGLPLDHALQSPNKTFAWILAGIVATIAAWRLVRQLTFGRMLVRPVSPASLRSLAIVAAGFGIIGGIAKSLASYYDETGVDRSSPLTFLAPLLILAIVAATLDELARSSGRRSINLYVVGLLGVQTLLGFGQNQKFPIVIGYIAYFLTILYFKKRIAVDMLAIAAGAFLVVTVVSPIIHTVRFDRENLSVWERITRAWEVSGDKELLARSTLGRSQNIWNIGYIPTEDYIADRFALVQYVDSLISAVDRRGPLGVSYIREALHRTLPSMVAPNKPVDSITHHAYVDLGIVPDTGRFMTFPTMSFFGATYAAFGPVGGWLLTLIGMVLILGTLKIAFGPLYPGLWVLYQFSYFSHAMIEGDVGTYFAFIFREVWFQALLCLVMVFGATIWRTFFTMRAARSATGR